MKHLALFIVICAGCSGSEETIETAKTESPLHARERQTLVEKQAAERKAEQARQAKVEKDSREAAERRAEQQRQAKQQAERQAKLEEEKRAEQEVKTAKEYYTERNRRFLSGLSFQKELYDGDKSSVAAMSMKFVVEDGPQRLTFAEPPYTLGMAPKRAGYTKGMKVIQIIDDSTMLLSIGSSIAMAVGWDSTSVVDGQTVRPQDAVIVSGTTEYTTVLGAKKRVYVIEPFNLIKYAHEYTPDIPQPIIEVVGEDVMVGDGQPKF